MPEGDVLEPDEGRCAHDSREPADPFGDDRVAFVRHRRRALLPLPEGLLDLGHLGAGQMPNLERKPLERGCSHRERSQELGVPVALDDLCGGGLRLEPEPLTCQALDLRIDCRVVADGAGELADPHAFERASDPSSGPVEVDAVRAADRDREAVLLRARGDQVERTVEPIEDQLACGSKLQRERRVDDIRGREPVVEPTARRAEPGRHGVDERGQVVLRLLLDLRHAGRGWGPRLRVDLLCRLGGYRPDLCPGRECRELDLEPPLEHALVRPDPGHGRAGVTSDHQSDSRYGPGRPVRPPPTRSTQTRTTDL